MICKAGGKSSKKPSYNILRKQFLEIRSLAGPVISKAARMGGAQRGLRISQRHEWRDGLPAVVQYQDQSLAKVTRGRF